jgi:hypothetical protein
MRSSRNPGAVASAPTEVTVNHDIEEVLSGNRSSKGDPIVSAQRRLLEAFMRLDGQSAEHILQETYAWADLEVVLVELLHGTVLNVYDRPELRPPYSPVAHFARSFVQRKFASLYNLSNPNDGRGPILSTAVEGEDHDLTLLLSAVFLSRAGFRIVFLGPNLPFDAFTAAIRIVRPAAVCLAATTEAAVATLREWQMRLSTLANGSSAEFGRLPVCFSGRVFVDQPELRDQIEGSFLGRAAQDSVAVVEAAIANHRG